MRYLLPLLNVGCFSVLLLASSSAVALSGAELIHNPSYRYGKFEARVRFAPGNGVVATYFLWKDGSGLPDSYWNEIDIEKVGSDCTGYSSNALYGQPQANHVVNINSVQDLCTDYHTHTVEWTPDSLIWLLDGVEVRSLQGADLQAYEDNALPGLQFRFNLWVGNQNFGGVLNPNILPVHQYINWVTYSEYTPGAGDNGTDFTLSWWEDFDAPLDATWSFADWLSPYQLSVHSPSNITITGGKAVMSLTQDDPASLGFFGTPPADPADLNAPPRPPRGAGGTSGDPLGMAGSGGAANDPLGVAGSGGAANDPLGMAGSAGAANDGSAPAGSGGPTNGNAVAAMGNDGAMNPVAAATNSGGLEAANAASSPASMVPSTDAALPRSSASSGGCSLARLPGVLGGLTPWSAGALFPLSAGALWLARRRLRRTGKLSRS